MSTDLLEEIYARLAVFGIYEGNTKLRIETVELDGGDWRTQITWDREPVIYETGATKDEALQRAMMEIPEAFIDIVLEDNV